MRFLLSLFKKEPYNNIANLPHIDCLNIEEKGYYCWFGYYDKSPINSSNEYVLYLRAKKSVKEGEFCEVCLYNLIHNTRYVIGNTNTWNWQQGAMEQWLDENTISYNYFDPEIKRYQTITYNIKTKDRKVFERAAYYFNCSFSKYISLIFYRLQLYAKGYGYIYDVDSLALSADGIWETDISNNETKLILPLSDIIAYSPNFNNEVQHYVNHIIYTPDEENILFIHRWQEQGGAFFSRLLLYNLKNKCIKTVLDNGHVSHFCWKSDHELLVYATNEKGQKGYMLVDINSGKNELFDGLPIEDGHPSFSQNRRWVLTDTYPNYRRNQYLFLFDSLKKYLYMIDKLHSPFKYLNEFRCDLHPRWSMDDRFVVIDNTSSGLRSLIVYKIVKI